MNFRFDVDDMDDVTILAINGELPACTVMFDESDEEPDRKPRKVNKARDFVST